MVNNKLYYTIENILLEIAGLITHTPSDEMPQELLDFYEELQHLSYGLEEALELIDLPPNDGAEEISDLYNNMLDLYFEKMEEKAMSL